MRSGTSPSLTASYRTAGNDFLDHPMVLAKSADPLEPVSLKQCQCAVVEKGRRYRPASDLLGIALHHPSTESSDLVEGTIQRSGGDLSP